MIKILKSIIIVYICFAALMTVFQRSFIYHPYNFDAYPIAEFQANNVLVYKTDELDWLWMPKEQTPRHILVYFHGNVWSAYGRREKAEEWRARGFDVVLVEYPGFGPRDGKPSEDSFYKTGRQVLNILQNDFPNIPITLYGESIGSGTAVQIATEFDVKGLVLETPFLSLEKIAQRNYPILPVRFLLWDKFMNDEKINDINAQLFIMHGTQDRVVPFDHGRGLYDLYDGAKQFYRLDGASHNNVYDHPDIDRVFDDIARRLL